MANNKFGKQLALKLVNTIVFTAPQVLDKQVTRKVQDLVRKQVLEPTSSRVWGHVWRRLYGK